MAAPRTAGFMLLAFAVTAAPVDPAAYERQQARA